MKKGQAWKIITELYRMARRRPTVSPYFDITARVDKKITILCLGQADYPSPSLANENNFLKTNLSLLKQLSPLW